MSASGVPEGQNSMSTVVTIGTSMFNQSVSSEIGSRIESSHEESSYSSSAVGRENEVGVPGYGQDCRRNEGRPRTSENKTTG